MFSVVVARHNYCLFAIKELEAKYVIKQCDMQCVTIVFSVLQIDVNTLCAYWSYVPILHN